LKKLGFVCIHQKGSHAFFENPDGRMTVVLMHQSEDIGKGLLSEILKDIKISVEKFNTLR